jgi:Tol biopolymer transport system component
MTNERFEMTVSAWLHEDAAARLPDHLGAVLAVTSRTRQRPAWSSLERWLPMDTTLRPGLAGMPRPGRVLLIAALLLAALGLVIVAVGSRQRSLPEPFGLARNGTFVTSSDGDIYQLDATTGAPSPLVAGSPFDFSPVFSRDGTRLVFLRSDGVPGDPAVLTMMAANADGTGIHEVTPPMPSLDWFDWSPDGTQVAFMSDGAVYIVDAAGGDPSLVTNKYPAHFPTWLPPMGDRLIFRAETVRPAIYEVRPDGTGLRPLTPRGTFRDDYHSLGVAPDGGRITYTRIVDETPHVFMLDLVTGVEAELPNADGVAQHGASFSPDGANVGYVRRYADGGYQVVVAPSDGSGDGRTVGPRMPDPGQGVGVDVWLVFTPDGSSLIVRYGSDDGAATRRIPIDGSESTLLLGTGTFQFVDVQRLRP